MPALNYLIFSKYLIVMIISKVATVITSQISDERERLYHLLSDQSEPTTIRLEEHHLADRVEWSLEIIVLKFFDETNYGLVIDVSMMKVNDAFKLDSYSFELSLNKANGKNIDSNFILIGDFDRDKSLDEFKNVLKRLVDTSVVVLVNEYFIE